MLFDQRTKAMVETHKRGIQMYSFDKDNNLFGKAPYKSYPQLKFKEQELPGKYSGSIHHLKNKL